MTADGGDLLPGDAAPLDAWLAAMYPVAAHRMAASISATHLVRRRTAFGQTIVPSPGSVVASPAFGFYDPEPDYFFHWLRDSALVMDACTLLAADGVPGADWGGHFDDFVAFSLRLNRLSGPETLASGDSRAGVEPDFRRYLRDDAELAATEGDRVLGESRYNPDGTLDRIRWSRPQFDGPAMRALAVLRHRRTLGRYPGGRGAAITLLKGDLDFVCRHWDIPSYDLWEDVLDLHYHTQLHQCAALEEGVAWAAQEGETEASVRYARIAASIRQQLDSFWWPERRIYRSHLGGKALTGYRQPDIAVVLAVVQTARLDRRHGILDERVHATLNALERIFAPAYGINRGALGAAMGRYADDDYFSGGAYFFATLAAAELYYRLAAALRTAGSPHLDLSALLDGVTPADGDAAGALTAKGDTFLATVRKYTPATGALSEQFDRETGEQTSARDLAWSYAAMLTAIRARRDAGAVAAQSLPVYP